MCSENNNLFFNHKSSSRDTVLIQYRYLKGKMLMLNFDGKLKLEGRNIIFIHICIIWGHLDAAFFFIYYKKNIVI